MFVVITGDNPTNKNMITQNIGLKLDVFIHF